MKMFEIRKIKKDKWLIILLVGLLLVVIAMPVSDIKSDQIQDEQQVQKAENASEDTYTDALETRLENALAKVEGVGNVKVMITLASSSEKVVEKDREMTSEVQEGESGEKNTSSSETAVYANGNGEEMPYVKQELSPRIEGVLVIADGGDNAIVIENITEAVQALFGVDTHKIKVMKHN
ncbi:stage III sporulation protein AG [Coprococcus comes]|uniref:stage III sporulation protein AG n=1 Tax=Coprococcus comes TaxID=410072 RepID=UPI00189A0FB1|nr:stage III sporulation protein AG [Coprococcus comes]